MCTGGRGGKHPTLSHHHHHHLCHYHHQVHHGANLHSLFPSAGHLRCQHRTSCSCSLLTSRWMCFCSCSLRQWLRPFRGVARAYAGYGLAASHSTCLPKGLGAHYNVQREDIAAKSIVQHVGASELCGSMRERTAKKRKMTNREQCVYTGLILLGKSRWVLWPVCLAHG